MAKGKLLLHMCCGPCAIFPVGQLQQQGYEVVGLFYNPNVHPLTEYLRRRDAAEEVAERLAIKVIFKDEEYDPAAYLRRVVYREASRCFYCYHLRLERTLSIARHGGFDAFSTTLLSSKRQYHERIAQLGADLAGGAQPRFLYQDFRAGWAEGAERSKQWSIYRQQYCGCIYSEAERYAGELRGRASKAGFRPSCF
jgi:hypothetical protein